MHATKPQTLAYGLNDSPAGLAAWIVENSVPGVTAMVTQRETLYKDKLLTNLTIYWTTQTINSSCRLYYETMHIRQDPGRRIDLPTAMSIFPKDLSHSRGNGRSSNITCSDGHRCCEAATFRNGRSR